MTEPQRWGVHEQLRAQMTRLRWLVNLRWGGFAGIAAAGVLTQIAGFTIVPGLGWAVLPPAVLYNLVFLWWVRRLRRADEQGTLDLARLQRRLRAQALLQALCDVLTLNALVYLNSGIECPILYVPLLAVMLGSVILPAWGLFLQANLSALLFAAMAWGEYVGWLPHIHFVRTVYQTGLYRNPAAVLSAVLAMWAIMNVAAYVMARLGGQLNQVEARIRGLLGKLRQEVQEAAGQLGSAAESLRGGGAEVSEVAGQIALTVQQIAQGAGEQAGQLERLRSNLGHLAEAAERVVAGAQESRGASASAVSGMERGREAVGAAQGRMAEIAAVFAQAEAALQGLAAQSEAIGEVASAIDRFAERTDLLALNAGIEAARAGEHGQGFAVVAGEVKKLAASSSASAARVGEMVRQVQAGIVQVAQSVQAGGERVRGGEASVAVLWQALGEMDTIIARTDELVGTMEHLARRQMEAHREIVAAAGELAGGAEETAAGAEETAAAVEEQASSVADFSQAVQQLADLATRLEQAVMALSLE
jgi:methyl-accepting chemotaxis protein